MHTFIYNLVEAKPDTVKARMYTQGSGWDGYQMHEKTLSSVNKNWKATF